MTVELNPAAEILIQRRIQSGAYSSAEEVIERALELLSSEEDWLKTDEIASGIQEGWDEAQMGQLTDDESVRAEMRQFKQEWEARGRKA